MRPCVLLSILFVVIAAPPASAHPKITRSTKLTEETYPAILEALRNLPVESHWKEIPWRPNFGEGIKDARQEDKPILLWVMNGHPCGMT